MRIIIFLLLSLSLSAQITTHPGNNTGPATNGNIGLYNLRYAPGIGYYIGSLPDGKAAWKSDSIFYSELYTTASTPNNPKKGDLWLSSASGNLSFWDGSTWQNIAGQSDWEESNPNNWRFIRNKPIIKPDSLYSYEPFGWPVLRLRDGDGEIEFDPSPFNEFQSIGGNVVPTGGSLLTPHQLQEVRITAEPKAGFFLGYDYGFEVDPNPFNELGNSYVRNDSLFHQKCQECEEEFVTEFYLNECENIEDELYISLQFFVDQVSGVVEERGVAINDTSTEFALKITGDGILLPKGDFSARPANVELGALRFNTSTNRYELYTGTIWESLKPVLSLDQSNGSYTEVNPIFIGSVSGNHTLNVNGTAIRLPRGFSYERPYELAEGIVRYNIGFKTLEYYDGATWQKVMTDQYDNYSGVSIDAERVGIQITGEETIYALDVHAKGAIHLNTSRPSAPSQGIFLYNKSTKKLEGYDGTNWIQF